MQGTNETVMRSAEFSPPLRTLLFSGSSYDKQDHTQRRNVIIVLAQKKVPNVDSQRCVGVCQAGGGNE